MHDDGAPIWPEEIMEFERLYAETKERLDVANEAIRHWQWEKIGLGWTHGLDLEV